MIQSNASEIKEEFALQNNLGSNSKFNVSVTTVMDVYCGCAGLISKLRSCGIKNDRAQRKIQPDERLLDRCHAVGMHAFFQLGQRAA